MALLNDCNACMRTYSTSIRQQWACGYEPAAGRGVVVEAWAGLGYKGAPPTTCPGYTTTLPETIEAARAWQWWGKGQLSEFCDRRPPTDALKLSIEAFANEVSVFERWLMTPVDQGGGRE